MTYAELTIPADELKLNLDVPELDDLSDYDVSNQYLAQSKAMLTSDIQIELKLNSDDVMDSIYNLNQSIIKKCLKLIQRRNIALNMTNVVEGSIAYMLLDLEQKEYERLKKMFKDLSVAPGVPAVRQYTVKTLFGG